MNVETIAVKGRVFRFLMTSPERIGDEVNITKRGENRYELFAPSSKFKQILKADEYRQIVGEKPILKVVKEEAEEVKEEPKGKEEEAIELSVDDVDKLAKNARRKELNKMNLPALRRLANELFEGVDRSLVREDLVNLILGAEYEED